MRVLHFLAETGFSGGELQLEHLVRHLHARGHDNHLALAPGAEFGRIGRELDVPVHEVALRRRLDPGTYWRSRRLVRRLRPEVVHYGCGRSLVVAGLACLGATAAVRYTTRRIDYPIRRGLLHGGRYRHLVDHVIANCAAVRDRVLAAGVPAERVTLVHEGIDVRPWQGIRGRRQRARETLGLPATGLVVSCAATLRPRKAQGVLIEAFAGLAADFPDATLVLAGNGPDRDRLREQARRLGLQERIRVPGPIRPVADLYAASDVFCMPSLNEGLSNACLEASAAGLPLVVSAVGGLTEIVEDGLTGAVVPPGQAGALGSALARYLADESLRDRTGAAGAERTARLFTADRMVRATEELLLQWTRA